MKYETGGVSCEAEAARCHPAACAMATALKPQIKTVDMSDEMTEYAIETSTFALGEYPIESQMANHIKREFDKKYRCAGSLA